MPRHGSFPFPRRQRTPLRILEINSPHARNGDVGGISRKMIPAALFRRLYKAFYPSLGVREGLKLTMERGVFE